MISFIINSADIENNIFIPKYYNPKIKEDLVVLKKTHHLYLFKDLVDQGRIELNTGNEIGKMSYGTGTIPFVRTSDISNWEIKTAPKQGVSEEIYEHFQKYQSVKEGDILIVRDGTYLIGTNCFISRLDSKILYQSHIIKVSIHDDNLDPYLFFLAINSKVVQAQIRARQFTADIIDTIGNRLNEVMIPIPKSDEKCKSLSAKTSKLLEERVVGKAFVKQCATIIENVLKTNSILPLTTFYSKSINELKTELVQDTVTAEFGSFECFSLESTKIKNSIFLPKYYSPSIDDELKNLETSCTIYSIQELADKGIISITTGDEIGKMSYGTGTIPFIRTSDFSNWEIKHNPKMGISQEIYDKYATKQNVRKGDIFLVRDGTYLVGTSCIVTEEDAKCLFCGGLYKISVNQNDLLNEWGLLALLNSYIVKRQLRTKQFTRDVIDTLGKRIFETQIPIPKDPRLMKELSQAIEKTVISRVSARNQLKEFVVNFGKA